MTEPYVMWGRDALAARCALLDSMLVRARDQFRYYAKNHRTKAEGMRHSADGRFKDDAMRRENLLEDAAASDAKADVNEALAADIDLTLGGMEPTVSGNLTQSGFGKLLDDVRTFHETFAPDWLPGELPAPLTVGEAETRAAWVKSEMNELIVDTDRGPVPNVEDLMAKQADAFLDAVYFACGGLVRMGLDPSPLWAIVHGQNMAKVHPDGTVKRREHDGKVIKPEGWVDPHELLVAEVKRQVGL